MISTMLFVAKEIKLTWDMINVPGFLLCILTLIVTFPFMVKYKFISSMLGLAFALFAYIFFSSVPELTWKTKLEIALGYFAFYPQAILFTLACMLYINELQEFLLDLKEKE